MNNPKKNSPQLSNTIRVLCLMLSGMFMWGLSKALSPKYFHMWELWVVVIIGILCIVMFLYTAIVGKGPGFFSDNVNNTIKK